MVSPNYFDYAAATPVDPDVMRAMTPYFEESFFNPSAGYLSAQRVAKDIKEAREKLARCLGVRASEIIFTAGGTEANNLAIHGAMQEFPNSEIIVSSIEHDSVLNPASMYVSRKSAVDAFGYVDLQKLKNTITSNTVMISVMYVNNEVGTIQSLGEISKIIEDVRNERKRDGNELPLYFHTDASQATNYLSLKVNPLGVDMMTVNGGKAYGPKQSGALWVRSGISLKPIIFGGGQERGIRSGTENVPAIIGLCEAVSRAQAIHQEESRRLEAIRKQSINQLEAMLPEAVINGGKRRIPNNIHITLPNIDNETVMMMLDESDYQVAVGSACSASNDEPSHVLSAMGLPKSAMQSSLRITMGRYTTDESAKNLISTLAKVYRSLA